MHEEKPPPPPSLKEIVGWVRDGLRWIEGFSFGLGADRGAPLRTKVDSIRSTLKHLNAFEEAEPGTQNASS